MKQKPRRKSSRRKPVKPTYHARKEQPTFEPVYHRQSERLLAAFKAIEGLAGTLDSIVKTHQERQLIANLVENVVAGRDAVGGILAYLRKI